MTKKIQHFQQIIFEKGKTLDFTVRDSLDTIVIETVHKAPDVNFLETIRFLHGISDMPEIEKIKFVNEFLKGIYNH